MNRINIIVFFIAIFTFALTSQAQEYEIEMQIDGISDTTVMLGYHLGDKKYVLDTAQIDSKGHGVFVGEEKLDKGIYLIVVPLKGKPYFEVLIDEDQKFKLHTSTDNYLENMKFKGSKANTNFTNYQRNISKVTKKMIDIRSLRDSLPEESDSVEIYNDQLRKLSDEHKAIMDKFVKDHPDAMFTKILKMMIDVELPEFTEEEEKTLTDSAKRSIQYKFARKHYFDNFDFSESGIVKTPVFFPRMDDYMKRLVPPVPDSIIPEVNALITRSMDNEFVYRHVLNHFVVKYQSSPIMGMDKVFVSIAEDWYLSGKADWADSTYLAKIRERVLKITPNLIGNTAPDIAKVPTSHDEWSSLHSIDADYTVLVFWEPHCGHCKKVVPKLHQLYLDTLQSENVEVFAVYTQVDKEEWIEFINDKEIDSWINVYDPYGFSNFRNNYDIYSTPAIYVLDKDKKIIGKRIDVDAITKLIDFDRTHRDDKKE